MFLYPFQNCLMIFFMNSVWVSHELLMSFSWIARDFLTIFSWISHDFLMTFLRLSKDFLMTFLWTSNDFHMTFLWFSNDFLMTLSWHYKNRNRPCFVPYVLYLCLVHFASSPVVTDTIFVIEPKPKNINRKNNCNFVIKK